MAVILLPLNLFWLSLLIRRWLISRDQFINWIQATLLGATAFGLWIVFITEFLSLFNALRFYPLIGSWAMLCLALLTLAYYHKNNLWDSFKRPSLSIFQLTLMAIIGFFILVAAGIGFISAPNNWDSMTYHLPRVMHWGQNQSIAHYATYEDRQLYQNPWAEFLITHLYLLTDTDRLFNLVQWAAMVGCIFGVSLIARLLGANVTGQILAGLITVTLPMGLLQAVSTQNDYVVAFWLVCFVAFMLLAQQNPAQFLYVWAMAISLGLAILTKGTAYIFATPFLVWYGLSYIKKYGWRLWQPILIIGLVVLLINGPHYYRNYRLFGSPLSPDLGDYDYANQTLGLSTLISNVPRNLALHFSTPLPALGRRVEQVVISFHALLGLDPNNPATTWPGYTFQVPSFIIDENISGNFIHLCLVFISLAFVIGWRLKQKRQPVFNYAMLTVLSFLLFAFYLKWQPWHSRLHLPLFILWSPILGLILAQIQPRLLTLLIVILLTFQAIPFLLDNPLHPVWSSPNIWNMPRSHQYFLGATILEEPYKHAVQEIIQARCSQLGLIMPVDAWEYPLWALFKQGQNTSVQIQSLEVANPSITLTNETFQPCGVVCLQCSEADLNKYSQLLGAPRLSNGPNLLFIKNP